MPITDIIARNAKPKNKAYKVTDEKSLYLYIKPNGSKYWRYKYYFAGKEKLLPIGVYPEITLKEARDKRDEARKMVREGIDPMKAKRDKKIQHMLENGNSLELVAREWFDNKNGSWTKRHARYTLRRLEANIFPIIGSRAVQKITAPELLEVLREVEKRDALDLSHRLLQICGQIFRYAIATGRAERDISVDLRGALKTRKKENFSYLKEKELPEFFSRLNGYDGDPQTKLGLRLLVLTFVRSTELRGAKWEEIDFAKAEWRIPAERMKMKEMHIVPLSKQALEILNQLKQLNGLYPFVLPSCTKPNSSFISENTLLYALYRMGYHGRATVHGFRATASTILNEHGFRPDVIERQLAHGERNAIRAAYNHAQHLPERREMMQWWADYLDELKGNGNVIDVNFGEAA
jgi:integrase